MRKMKARWEKGKKENEKGREEKERRENKKQREKLLESKKNSRQKEKTRKKLKPYFVYQDNINNTLLLFVDQSIQTKKTLNFGLIKE